LVDLKKFVSSQNIWYDEGDEIETIESPSPFGSADAKWLCSLQLELR
jgi:hypothetical protein